MRHLGAIFTIFTLIFAETALCAQIQKIKNEKALIDITGESIAVSDQFLVLEGEQQIGSMKIKSIKDNRAIGIIESGKLQSPGSQYTLVKVEPKLEIKSEADVKRKTLKNQSYGFLIGYGNTTAKVDLTSSSRVSLTGGGMNATGFYRKDLTKSNTLEARLRYNSIAIKANSASASLCAGEVCKVQIGYLDFTGIFRFNKTFNVSQLWTGIGANLLVAVSKESNIIDPSKISTQQSLVVVMGYDKKLNEKAFLPISIEFNTFMYNSAASINQFHLNVGYGINF